MEHPPTLLQVAAGRHRALQKLLSRRSPGLSPDAVHDLRVAARRLTEVVRVFAPLMEKPAADATRAALKSLRRSAGELRDLDVMTDLLAGAALPAPLRKLADALSAGVSARRDALVEHVHAARRAPSVTGGMVYLAGLFERPPTPAAMELLASRLTALIRKRRRQLRRAFGRAATRQTPAALHVARIATKKLRYLLELSDESRLDPAADDLTLLKEIQTVLGDHHDTHVLLETLRSHVDDTGTPARPDTWRLFQSRLQRRQARRASIFFTQSYVWNNH